jgi:Leucine-rich repeat (LRR) protein
MYLECEGNQLTNLDIRMNTLFMSLNCSDNKLTSLDLSANALLEFLFCENNQLTGLDVTALPRLFALYCGGNQLSSLDLSNNKALSINPGYYYFGYHLSLKDMPGLQNVCVWTLPFPPNGFLLDKKGSPNVNFTTDCSK